MPIIVPNNINHLIIMQDTEHALCEAGTEFLYIICVKDPQFSKNVGATCSL